RCAGTREWLVSLDGRLDLLLTQKVRRLCGGQRLAVEKSLGIGAFRGGKQESLLFFRLHTLGDNLYPKLAGQMQHQANRARIRRVERHRFDELGSNLKTLDLIRLQA